MFKSVWDKETGGVRLINVRTDDTLSVSPRPVFFEELDLLELDRLGWKYPRCKEPLMWACNKQYFYRGQFVFEAKGANLYDKAQVVLQPGCEKMALKPVDMAKMLERCEEELFLIGNEAIEFIRDTYQTYSATKLTHGKAKANQLDFEALAAKAEKMQKRKMAIVKEDCDSFDIVPLDVANAEGKKILQTTAKIDVFLASFSGGKDSQVVLDLCTRALPPSAFQVIYSDTGYELPPSLELYEEVKRYYGEKYPELLFRTARNHESVLNYWDKIGTPSDTHRWCCSVMKTAPLYRMLKVDGTNKQARVLAFDGVRAEESTRRSGYSRIGKGVKHNTTINARPILDWSTTEIFLYLFNHELPINPAYREGITRVGCVICPFANEWNEMVAQHRYQAELKPFVDRIELYSKKAGVKDVKKYVAEGGWKRRASGNWIEQDSFIEFKNNTSTLCAIIKKPKLDALSFLQTIGNYITTDNGDKIFGELKTKGGNYDFSVVKDNGYQVVTIENISDVVLIGYIKRALFKSVYCIQCEACEVECPTGALSILPDVHIDKTKCVQCKKCLEFHEKGCIAANSLYITTGNNMKTGNIDRYKNFGLKYEWGSDYLVSLNDYWTSNHGLNENYQIPSLKAWLRDAEIIDDKNNVTELGKLLANSEVNNFPDLIWEIIWINLSHNSFIVNWFINNIRQGEKCSQKIMEQLIKDMYPAYKEKTVHNAVYQIRRTLKESPIGDELNQYNEDGKEDFIRLEHTYMNRESLAYSIYKYAQKRNIKTLRIADLMRDDIDGGVCKEFCLSKTTISNLLLSLSSMKNRVLTAELNMGLDHITLRDDLSPFDVLRELVLNS